MSNAVMDGAKAEPVLRTMDLSELAEEMRSRGMAIGQEKLKLLIKKDKLPFATCVEMSNDEFVIFKKGFLEWVEENSVMETPK